jgi:phospholipase C
MGIENISHFVVLMLENRSFDHVFGLRKGVEGIIDGHGKPRFSNPDAQGHAVAAQGGAPFAIPTKHGLGPLHNLVDVNEQILGKKIVAARARPEMAGFVASYIEALTGDTRGHFTAADVAVVMQSFDPGALPAISALADNFVLCDHWFSEVPGPTHPNRLYMHAGTSAGFVHNVFKRPFDLLTIYELLARNGQSWAVYDFDLNEVKLFTRIADQLDNFRRFTPRFAQDVETGALPNYSFIIPRFTATVHAPSNDQHAPHDVRWGEQLIADIYDTLRAKDEVWQRTAFIVTYDEHGGFFDHVAPPATVSPHGIASPRADDNFNNHAPPPFAFDRLGLRVPTLIASPWVGKGVVAQDAFQHSSILRTVRDRFGIGQSLSAREAAAPSLADLFDQKEARDTPPTLPRPAVNALPPADHHANPGNQFPDALHREMAAGVIHATRPSHPEDDDAPPVLPNTQHELSAFVHRRWTRHSKWLAG